MVANEFYDPAGRFSQAAWADQLLQTFKVQLESIMPAQHEVALDMRHACAAASMF